MQHHPVVAVPMADDRQGNLIQLLDQLGICLSGLGAESKGLRTSPQAQQCGAIAGGANDVTHMAQAEMGPIASRHGCHAGGSAILLVKLAYAGVGRIVAGDNTPYLLDQRLEEGCDRPAVMDRSEHAMVARIRRTGC